MAETVGSLVDKITITDLKIYHMQEQVGRPDASPEHREACERRVNVLEVQKKDLVTELNDLVEHVKAGQKEIKVYRQFKMYNDPVYRPSSSRP